jgi:diguanylate cyclase (GGDEF)-like protein
MPVGRALMPATERFSILLVDDDPMVARILSRILREFAPIRYANSGREALKLARESVPDLVLLDANMPEMSGFAVCEAFKLDPALAQVPIIFVTAHENGELHSKALQLGAADFISKPPQGPVVLARVRTFLRMKMLSDTLSDTLQKAVTMDFITGAVTGQQLENTLQQEWQRARRSAAPLALLLTEIDGFDAYNAEFGEATGDACLKSVADALRSVLNRPADVLGHYAAGRFGMLLPETDVRGATTVAQRAIDAVEGLQIPHAASSARNHITLWVGAGYRDLSSVMPGDAVANRSAHTALEGAVADDLIAAAEQALKEARSDV